MSSIEITTQSDDGTHLKARIFYENGKIIREATRKFGEVHVYFTNMLFTSMLDSYTYALYTNVLGWQMVQIEVFLPAMRQEIKDLSNHLYTHVHFVYGRKPQK
ncbi:hypothetical protein MAP00_004316 [Monascus purpureus]|nr:hypothetical protein MAP00_004316 [Monascus purpureus]